jgi:hypothetical protein
MVEMEKSTVLVGRNPVRSADFAKILNQFQWYYCKGKHPCQEGDTHYYNWLNSLGLDETKAYAKSAEAFRWAKDMISLAKEDQNNKYYKVLVGFPIESMNGNVYTESELKDTAESLTGVTPNLNHKEYWTLKGAEFIGSKFEGGAVEALLKVPKELMCPDCNKKKTICDLIDEKKIVNVSLEASCLDGNDTHCKGMRLTGCALLTVETLPGIPLARIFPIESFIQTEQGVKPKLSVKVVMTKEKKPEVGAEPAPTPKTTPKKEVECPDGMTWDSAQGICIPACPEGKVWDEEKGGCVDPEQGPEATSKDPNMQGKSPKNEAEVNYIPAETYYLELSDARLKVYNAEKAKKTFEEKTLELEKMLTEYSVANMKLTTELETLRPKIVERDKQYIEVSASAAKTKAEAEVHLDDAKKQMQKTREEAQLKIDEEFKKAQALVESAEKKAAKIVKDSEILVESAEAKTLKVQKEMADRLDDASKRFEEITMVRDGYKKQYEDLLVKNTELDKKYQTQLNNNLELTRGITAKNEELLKLNKEFDEMKKKLEILTVEQTKTSEELTKAKRLGKIIAKV